MVFFKFGPEPTGSGWIENDTWLGIAIPNYNKYKYNKLITQ